MTRNTLLALTAALAATLSVSSAAQAGGGVRLGFGFPLGSFTATPAHGGGKSAYVGSSYAAKKAKAEARAEARAEAARRQKAEASRQAAAKSDAPAKVAAKTGVEDEKTEGSFVEAPSTSALLTKGDIAGPAERADQTAPADVAAAMVEGAGEGAATEVASATDNAALAADDSKSGGEAVEASSTETGCKRFIPAVGVTVSVGC